MLSKSESIQLLTTFSWNANKKYNVTENNCQVFTDELFKILEIKTLSQAEERFLKSLFKIDLEGKGLDIEYTFECDKTTVRFRSHADVDKECGNREGEVLLFVGF